MSITVTREVEVEFDDDISEEKIILLVKMIGDGCKSADAAQAMFEHMLNAHGRIVEETKRLAAEEEEKFLAEAMDKSVSS